MKEGEFVDVHFEEGCLIGRLVSDDGETVAVEFDHGVIVEVPKQRVTPFGY